MKLTHDLLLKTLDKSRELFYSREDGRPCYEFAVRLVKQCNIIGTQANIGKKDMLTAQFSGLFLYWSDAFFPVDHAGVDFEKIKSFLLDEQVDQEAIDEIEACISSVLPPQVPETGSGQLLCDALNSLLVEKGKNALDRPVFSVPGFFSETDQNAKDFLLIQYLGRMVFFNNAAKKALDKPLQKKLSQLQRQHLQPIDNQNQLNTNNSSAPAENPPSVPKADRGAATLFRNASREHIAMLSIVHQKSGFLLSFNSILLSVMLTYLPTKFIEFPHLLLPTVLLVITCLGTIVFTILATRPMIIRNRRDPLARDTFNAMFFGHYVHLDWSEYSKQIKGITSDVDDMVEVLSKNIYYQGVVLDRKYRLLSIAYKIFLFGLIISVTLFIISFFKLPISINGL